MIRILSGVFLVCALGAWPASAQLVPGAGETHPAFWVVHAKDGGGVAYILSSVHALPSGIGWRRPDINQAIHDSDTFVFEVPTGRSEVDEETRFIVDRGLLPRGQTLQSLLSPAAQKNYIAACALAGMTTDQLDNKKPWLAAVVLTVSYMNQRNFDETNAPDSELLGEVGRYDKRVRYFDTTDEQLEFLARFDSAMGISGFSTMLDDFPTQPQREDALIGAWRVGDTDGLARMIDASFAADPEGKNILDAHNRVWASRLEDMLREDRTYFVTVGVAHLVGAAGVPALLRADGYKVEGP